MREGERSGQEQYLGSPDSRSAGRRYDRLASIYDAIQLLPERGLRAWREHLWAHVKGPRVLEVGVGTGLNMPYYPPGVEVVGIDVSARMLERARRRAEALGLEVQLCLMDVQHLRFPDDSFDSAVATCVFCSVPDAVRGLREVARVVKPRGKVLFLEHVRARNPLLGAAMDVLDPLVSRVGPHISRRTVENIRHAGLEIEREEDLDRLGIMKLVIARVASGRGSSPPDAQAPRRLPVGKEG
ncbi:MAG: class I SAM-dependent methyltransferase [Anaerolineae bacterium]|nr:class I SAM-dependent methyltransferase [Anaerolineae bacterium]